MLKSKAVQTVFKKKKRKKDTNRNFLSLSACSSSSPKFSVSSDSSKRLFCEKKKGVLQLLQQHKIYLEPVSMLPIQENKSALFKKKHPYT